MQAPNGPNPLEQMLNPTLIIVKQRFLLAQHAQMASTADYGSANFGFSA